MPELLYTGQTLYQTPQEAGALGRVFFVGTTSAAMGVSASDEGNGLLSDNSTYGLDPSRPFATIDYALGRCVANRGDTIYVLPGHSETITAAAGIDVDIAGVSIIGQGRGTNRPTINFTNATDTFQVSAANCLIKNFYFDCTGVDALAVGVDVNALGTHIEDCYFLTADAGGQALIALDIGAHIDCVVKGCTFYGVTTPDAGSTQVNISGVATGLKVIGCDFTFLAQAAGVGALQFSAAALNILIMDCTFDCQIANETTAIDFQANACTGQIVRCYVKLGNITTAGSGIDPFVSTGAAAFVAVQESYVVNDQGAASECGEAGVLIGDVGT